VSDAQGESMMGAVHSDNGMGPGHEVPAPVAGELSSRDRRPEVAVGAAFAGGLLLAILLRRVRSRDDG
jgi:hypothetical protein